MRQVAFIAMYVALGILVQSMLFKTESNTWIEAWTTWPGLWVVYFVVSHVVAERFGTKPTSNAQS